MRRFAIVITLSCPWILAPDAATQDLTFTQISTQFNSPVGIDHHHPTNSVVVSVNYSSGLPHTLERIEFDGTHVQFSDIAGFTDEVKIATVRPGNPGGFVAGDLFVGNGVDGQVVRITDGGATVSNPWVDLPGTGNGLMRGSLHVDRTGTWAGDLLVATTLGEVWRITSAGVPSFIADVNVHLEGLHTVPDDVDAWGPIAGKAIAGAEGQGLLYAFGTDGSVQTFSLGVAIEDIDLIPENENFFGVNFGTSKILGVPASQFDPVEGQFLLTMESVTGSGLFHMSWNGASLQAAPFGLAPGSATVGQWEHVTFSPAGIVEIDAIPVCELSSGPSLGASVGVPVTFSVTGSDPDPEDAVTVSVAGLPSGAALNPALPATGNPIAATFTWTPTNADLGTHVIVFTVTDEAGQSAVCTVTIEVAECYLAFGISPASVPITAEETLYVQPLLWIPTTMETLPVFHVPNDPRLIGMHIYAQVWMVNADIFPDDPIKASDGLDTVIGGDSTSYGAPKGMHMVGPGSVQPGGAYSVGFTIDGL